MAALSSRKLPSVPLKSRGFEARTLSDHFQRHGAEFLAATEIQYEVLADIFLCGNVPVGCLERVRRALAVI